MKCLTDAEHIVLPALLLLDELNEPHQLLQFCLTTHQHKSFLSFPSFLTSIFPSFLLGAWMTSFLMLGVLVLPIATTTLPGVAIRVKSIWTTGGCMYITWTKHARTYAFWVKHLLLCVNVCCQYFKNSFYQTIVFFYPYFLSGLLKCPRSLCILKCVWPVP